MSVSRAGSKIFEEVVESSYESCLVADLIDVMTELYRNEVKKFLLSAEMETAGVSADKYLNGEGKVLDVSFSISDALSEGKARTLMLEALKRCHFGCYTGFAVLKVCEEWAERSRLNKEREEEKKIVVDPELVGFGVEFRQEMESKTKVLRKWRVRRK